MVKKSDHIRIRPEDKKKWAAYCEALGVKSPDLFSKIMKSERIKLNQRIAEELNKKREDFIKKLSLPNEIKKFKKG